MPLRIRSLDGPQTRRLLQFCLECGCDLYEATPLHGRTFATDLTRLFTSEEGTTKSTQDVIAGEFRERSSDLLAVHLGSGILPQGGEPLPVHLSIRCTKRNSLYLETLPSDRSVILNFVNDLQAEALYRLAIEFQVSPERPDLKPAGNWVDYGASNLYLHAPPEISLDPQRFDRARWAGDRETYGCDWYRSLENKYIARWWTPRHDEVLTKAIREHGWGCRPPVDELVTITPLTEIQLWKESDGRCHRWTWQNILGNFAAQRAKQLELAECGEPTWLSCPLCSCLFHQSRSRSSWLTIRQAVVCPPCFDEAVWGGRDHCDREEITAYLLRLSEVIEEIPQSNFGLQASDYIGLSAVQVIELIRLLKNHPSLAQVKEVFGSWFAALVAAKVLPSGSQQMARGVRCIAADGHDCLSLGEKTICDILYRYRVPHLREVPYPGGSSFRADWTIGEILVEYFGLAGDPSYDTRIKAKKKLAAANGLTLIAIYPKDLADRPRLLKILGVDTQRDCSRGGSPCR